MPRTITRKTAAAVSSLLLAGAAALAVQGCDSASTAQSSPRASAVSAATTSAATTSVQSPTAQSPTATESAPPYDFIDLPTSPVVDDHRPHEFDVAYRNSSPQPQLVAPQILVQSPDTGPFLEPSDVRLERLDPASGRWQALPLGTQTGTLYTQIPPGGQALGAGETLDVRYRLTVVSTGAAGQHAVVQPRIVVYHAAAGASGTAAAAV